jgi:hypothetical protein
VNRNAFLFETLARSSEAVVFCASGGSEAEGWLGAVPAGVPVCRAEGIEPEQWKVIELLRQVAAETT